LAEVELTLSTICEGNLEAEFQSFIPALLSQLKHGQKATVAITIDIKRVADTSTMITAAYSITPKFPAIKKASICRMTGDNKLITEEAPEPMKVVNLFTNIAGGNK